MSISLLKPPWLLPYMVIKVLQTIYSRKSGRNLPGFPLHDIRIISVLLLTELISKAKWAK